MTVDRAREISNAWRVSSHYARDGRRSREVQVRPVSVLAFSQVPIVSSSDRVQLVLKTSGNHSTESFRRITEFPVAVVVFVNHPFQDVVVGMPVLRFSVRQRTVQPLAIRTIVRTLDNIVLADVDETEDGINCSSSLERSETERLETVVLEAVINWIGIVEAVRSFSHSNKDEVDTLRDVLRNDTTRVLSR